MTDDLLIGYCETHCETERALFKGEDVNRMIALAGYPRGFVRSVNPNSFISVHDEMKELCRLARERQAKAIPLKTAKLYQFLVKTQPVVQ